MFQLRTNNECLVAHTNMNNSNIKFYTSLEHYSISSLAFHFFSFDMHTNILSLTHQVGRGHRILRCDDNHL